ncbi:MAG TPA: penicillin-binding protein [Mycobacteriales bacterium]|nr:penicillin-binding protein [Mycobacteriales bacterium]
MQRPQFKRSAGVLFAVSVAAGLVMAAVLLPYVGTAGLVARHATSDFESLPSNLKRPPLPEVSRILAADGSPIAQFYDQNRTVVPLSKIPVEMQKAIIAIEDVRFYEHSGIDLKGMIRALLRNGSSGSVSQGGSTLTQQYVKNVLIEDARTKKQRDAAVADTLARKVKEARYALALEHQLSKSQILEDYLNIAYFGDGAYGVGAAARHFFNEPVQKLSLSQSALLAGLVQSPEAYNPRFYPKAAHDRRDTVLAQMLHYQFITQAQYDHARSQPIRLHIQRQANGCTSSQYGYFCDYVVNHALKQVLSPAELRAGGFTITTTLSPKVQHAADEGVHAYVHAREPSHAIGAEAVVQPGTGEVKALAVSTPYGNNKKKGENSIDYAVDQKYGGSQYGFHAGSTFKLFVLAAALKEGIPLSTSIHAPQSITVTGYKDCAGRPLSSYPLHNAGDSESGTFDLKTGTWFSVNTFYAQLEQRTGVCEPVKLAESMGVHPAGGGPIPQVPSFVLGSAAGFSPLDLAGAYATMAAHGKYCPPVVITKIVDRHGHSLPVPPSQCRQVVPSGLADTVTSILQGVLTVPGATGTEDVLSGRPAAAKTGTVDNYAGSWFAGYTPQLASAVCAGIPSSPNRSLGGLTIGGRYYGSVFGATLAGRIWQATMNAALAGAPVKQFNAPNLGFEAGTQVKVPDVAGMSVQAAADRLHAAGFTVTESQYKVPALEPRGAVARTSPAAGSTVPKASTVEIFLSNGQPPPHQPEHGGGGDEPGGPPASESPTPPGTSPSPTDSASPTG